MAAAFSNPVTGERGLPDRLDGDERRLARIKVVEVFRNRNLIAGEDEIRPDVGQRLEDEAARGQARVGEIEQFAVDPLLAEVEDVDVDDPRGVSFRRGDAAEAELDGLGGVEQVVGAAGVADLDDGVVEIRRLRRAGDRLGLIDGGLEQAAGFGDALQQVAGILQVAEAVAEIRAEGDAGGRGGGIQSFKLRR